MRRLCLIVLIGSEVLIGCAHKQVFNNLGKWNEEQNKSVSLRVLAYKQKRKRADVNVVVENHYPFIVVIPENSLHLDVNGKRAFGDSNAHWVLRPGDVLSKQFTFTFQTFQTNQEYQRGDSIGPVILSLALIFKGEEATGTAVETRAHTSGSGIAAGGRNIAIGVSSSNTESNSQLYPTRTAIEGKQLQPIEIQIPDQKNGK